MRNNVLVPLAVSLLFLSTAYGQQKAEGQLPPHAGRPLADSGACADVPGQATSTQGVTHKFRYVGETIEIAIRGDNVPASVADCEPVALELRWTNGRNNGSNFNVSFLDGNNRSIYGRQITAFLTGEIQFSLSSYEVRPAYGSSLAITAFPSTVTIQAAPPFAAPASLTYTVTRVARPSRAREKGEAGNSDERERREKQGNEIVSIHNAVRLIGASQLPVVQIELKTSRPFPVRDIPLRLQIGKTIFVDELSGDYTGRKLTLSLTPEMFAQLKDGDEIVAFFSKPDGNESADQAVWNFGKLSKARRQEQ